VNAGTLLLGNTAGVAIPGALLVGDGVGGSNADVVRWTAPNQVANTAAVTVNSSGLLDLNNQADRIGPLTLSSGSVTTGTGTLTLGGDVTSNATAQTATISGHVDLGGFTRTFTVARGSGAPPDLLVSAAITGPLTTGQIMIRPGLTKAGTGTLDLTAANTYVGITTINAGTLLVDGSQPANSVVVNTGGTLGGNGTVDAITPNGGTLLPGSDGLGHLSTNSDLTLTSTSTFSVQLSSVLRLTSTQPVSGVLNVTGAVNLANAVLSVALGNASNVGDQFTILNNTSTSPIVGTFNGLPQGAILLVGGQRFQISYVGGANFRNVVLTHLNSLSQFPHRQVTTGLLNGQTATLTGTPSDPDPLDTFILDVNWGDGSAKEEFSFPPGTPAVSLQHTYQDANLPATLMDEFPVQLVWTDQHGDGSKSDTLHVTVFSGPNPRTVAGLYPALLQRPVDRTGLAGWTALLGVGVPMAQIVLGIEHSLEYRSNVVQGLYATYLHRPADPLGLASSVALLNAGGTVEQVAANLVGSAEYFQGRAGGSNGAFVDALYQDVFHRAVDAGGRAGWGQALSQQVSRTQIAEAIFHSAEYQQNLVQSYYSRFLKRPADPVGLIGLAGFLKQGIPDELVAAVLLGSDEYRNLASV
jgi:autotransporter-associated beta strand protein